VFLHTLPTGVPHILAEEGALDAAVRRNRLLEHQAAAWRRSPPSDPVIAAGLIGGFPALTGLLSVVTTLSRGAVILPGLDRRADEPEWRAVGRGEAPPPKLLPPLPPAPPVPPPALSGWPPPPPPSPPLLPLPPPMSPRSSPISRCSPRRSARPPSPCPWVPALLGPTKRRGLMTKSALGGCGWSAKRCGRLPPPTRGAACRRNRPTPST